ncbi:MAG: hypothetical protein GY841_10425 [FCB group bacterium]|nr:hypothetical protein [FCB group bacterium]
MSNLDFIKTENFKLTKRLELRLFNERLDGQFLDVWLNLDSQWWGDWQRQREMGADNAAWIDAETARIAALPDAEQEAASDEYMKRIEERTAEMLDFAADVRARLWGCETTEVKSLYAVSQPLYVWCTNEAIELVLSYRDGRKKKPNTT